MIATTCVIGVRVEPSQTAWVTGRGTAAGLAGAALAVDWMAATALAVRTAAAISTGLADLDLIWHPFAPSNPGRPPRHYQDAERLVTLLPANVERCFIPPSDQPAGPPPA